MAAFPTVKIEEVEIPKVLIGINSLLDWSHTSAGRDQWIRRYFTVQRIAQVFAKCIELGVTGVLGPAFPKLIDAIKKAEDMTGCKLTFVSTTLGDKETTNEQVKTLKEAGSPICLIHGGWTDRWPVRDNRLEDLEYYLGLIRDAGMVPGVACHDGERLSMVDQGGYDVAVFAIPVNKMGFYMSPSCETVLQAVNNSSKPVIAIKPLASGRFDQGKVKEWLRWSFDVKGVAAMAIGFMSFEFLDKELGRISKKGLAGRRVDALVKVYLRDGGEQWLLVHIEVQGYPQKAFERRMYVYNYRIFDRYNKDVVSLAVLTDEDTQFRLGPYLFEIGDFRLEMVFPVVKLLDYWKRWGELETSENPFSVVVMAHLKAQETRRKAKERLDWKLRLTRMLYERGYSKEEILGLYRFIDLVIRLPEKLEEVYHEEVFKEEEVKAMPYITTAERIGMRKAQQEMVLEALEERFGSVPPDVEGEVKGIRDRDALKRLHRQAIRCGSLEEFREALGEATG